MKSFQAICLGYEPFMGKPIARGTPCVIRLDAEGNIDLVSADGVRFDGRGVPIKPYELREYFKLGFSAPL